MNIKENYQQYVSRYASEVAALKRKNTGFITGELLAFGGILAFLICYFAMDGDTQNYLLGAVLCLIAYLEIRRLDDKNKEMQVDGFCFIRALLGREVVDGQGGLAGLAQLPQALLDERQIQRIGVLVVQRAVRQAGVELCALEEIVQTDDVGRGAALFQCFGDAVGAGGLAAGRRAGEHDDLGAGKAHLFGGVLHAVAVALLTQGGKFLRTAGGNVVQPDFNQTFRDPNRDHKNQPLLFSVPAPPQTAGYTRSDT